MAKLSPSNNRRLAKLNLQKLSKRIEQAMEDLAVLKDRADVLVAEGVGTDEFYDDFQGAIYKLDYMVNRFSDHTLIEQVASVVRGNLMVVQTLSRVLEETINLAEEANPRLRCRPNRVRVPETD